MDLRNLPDGLSPKERIAERRKRIEDECDCDLSLLEQRPSTIGHSDEKNCENMFGSMLIPVGYAGPLMVHFSSQKNMDVHLPLATTEGALVASVNRGCKALNSANGVHTSSVYHGISRSIAIKTSNAQRVTSNDIKERKDEWKTAAESTSNHLKILSYDIDETPDHIFLTINADTDEAMGMNMVTIAAQAVGNWIVDNIGGELITIAANVDSDKKPSKRTHEKGRGYEVTASATIPSDVITSILKSDPEAMMNVAKAKLEQGSDIAGALGANMHAANIIAALYLATGQDAAHVVEGSLTDTTITKIEDGLKISVRCPAILVGLRGGGTDLPAQRQCLDLLLQGNNRQHLAESIGAAVLAGEVSLLAAQAAHHLAKAHAALGR